MYNWSDFINKTKILKPRELLIGSFKYVVDFNYALDFGAGGLRDTRYLLKYPFKQVDILDGSEDTKLIANSLKKDNIEVFIQKYETYDYIPNRYNIINAQFALPFIEKGKQTEVLEKLKNSLSYKGVFVGNFFGVKDSWNDGKHNGISFHTKEEVKEILKDLDIVHLKEKEYNKKSVVDGVVEKWHVIEFIAINRSKD